MSTTITFPFTNSANYLFDAALVNWPGTLAELTDLRPAGATFYGAFDQAGNPNANWSNGVGTGTLFGTASVPAGYLDCHNDGDSCEWGGGLNVGADPNVGCIRIRQRTNDVTPVGNSALFGIATAWNNANNALGVYARPGGQHYLQYKDSLGVGTNINMGIPPGLPVEPTWFEWELNWDLNDVAGKVITYLVDGVLLYQSGVVRARTNTVGWLSAGASVNRIWNQYDNEFDDILIFDNFQHKANYTPDWSGVPLTAYSIALPTVQPIAVMNIGAINTFVETATKPAGTEIKYQFRCVTDGSVWLWHNGASWVAAADTSEANTAAEVQAQGATIGACGNKDAVRAILNSTGNATPQLDNLVINYEPTANGPDFLSQSSGSVVNRGPRTGRPRRGTPYRRYHDGR